MILSQFEQINDALRKQEWQASIHRQMISWKDKARFAVGASASIGVAVGGMAAIATGAVVAVAQGIMQGAASAGAGQVCTAAGAGDEVPDCSATATHIMEAQPGSTRLQ